MSKGNFQFLAIVVGESNADWGKIKKCSSMRRTALFGHNTLRNIYLNTHTQHIKQNTMS